MFDVAVVLLLFAIIVVRIAVGHSIGEQSNHNGLLLFGQAVDDIFNGVAIFGVFLVAIGGLLAVIGRVISFAFICMGERDRFVGAEDDFLLSALSMSKIDKVDEGSGICTATPRLSSLMSPCITFPPCCFRPLA